MFSFEIIIEVTIAAGILSLSSLLSANLAYTNPLGIPNQINQFNSVYDFFNVLENNQTYKSCFLNRDYACTSDLLEKFQKVYNLVYISYHTNGFSDSYGNETNCRYDYKFCIPVEKNSSFNIACLNTCSD